MSKSSECASCGVLFPDNKYFAEFCTDCSIIGQMGLLQNATKHKSRLHHVKNVLIMAHLKTLKPEEQNEALIKDLDKWAEDTLPDFNEPPKPDDVQTIEGILGVITGLNKRHPTIEIDIFIRSNVTGESYIEPAPIAPEVEE